MSNFVIGNYYVCRNITNQWLLNKKLSITAKSESLTETLGRNLGSSNIHNRTNKKKKHIQAIGGYAKQLEIW